MRSSRLLGSLAALALLSLSSFAYGALNAYLKIKGSKTAKFNPTIPSDKFKVVFDALPSGQATGKRTHMPIRARMYYDQTTAAFLAAYRNKELLPAVRVEFAKPASNGKEAVYYTITLTDSTVTNIKLLPGTGRKMAEIEFSYRQAAVDKTLQKAVGVDDWMKSN